MGDPRVCGGLNGGESVRPFLLCSVMWIHLCYALSWLVRALTRVQRVCGACAWFDACSGLAGWLRSAHGSMLRVGGLLGLRVSVACRLAMRAVSLAVALRCLVDCPAAWI